MITIKVRKKLKIRFAFYIFLVVLTKLFFIHQPLQAKVPENRLVTTDWLQSQLHRPDLRIIDMRADIRDYWAGHIPGAVYLDETALRWPEKGVPGKLMPVEVLVKLLQQLGISRKTTVIIYTEINNYRATYFAWALDYLRHESWAILDGGFNRWKNEGRPTNQDYPALTTSVYEGKIKPDEEIRASLDQVRKPDPKVTVLLDVRPPEFFSGERGTWKRRGHIPGALNIPWSAFLKEDGSWRDLELIRNNLNEMGIMPAKTIILYCGQGLMASHTYLTLKYILKFPTVKIYDGGFNEWSNREDLPVETGDSEKK